MPPSDPTLDLLTQSGIFDADDCERLRRAHSTDPDATCSELVRSLSPDSNTFQGALELAATLDAVANICEPTVTPEADGRYARMEALGEGGMGKVELVDDGHLHRHVARKELRVDNPALAARFLREARITAQLEHPGIVPVYELGRRPDGSLYYTMKRVRGGTLQDSLEACPTLKQRLGLLDPFSSICQAVGYAHSKGVVHRDLKPDNVMLGPFGETLVVDWGLAYVVGTEDLATIGLDADESGSLTRAGSILGTPKYMSPEQAQGQPAGPRSDVWSLGAMLADLLLGHPLFDGAGLEIVAELREGTEDPALISADAPPELMAIARKALRREQCLRYANGSEMANDLDAWRNGNAVAAHDYSMVDRLRRTAMTYRVALVGTVGVLGALIAATAVYGPMLAGQRDLAQGEAAEAQLRAALAEAVVREQAGKLSAALAWVRHAIALPQLLPASRHDALVEQRRLIDLGGDAKLVDLSGRYIETLAVHDWRAFVSGGDTAQIVDLHTGETLHYIHRDELVDSFSEASALSGDEWYLGSSGFWVKVDGDQESPRIPIDGSVVEIEPSPDGSTVALRVFRHDHFEVDVTSQNGELRYRSVASNASSTSIIWSADGSRLFVQRPDALDIVDSRTWALHKTLVPGGALTSVALGLDVAGPLVLAAGEKISVWTEPFEQPSMVFGDQVKQVVLAPDGQRIAAATKDGNVGIWTTSGELTQTLVGHNALSHMRFSSDGAWLLTDDIFFINVWETSPYRTASKHRVSRSTTPRWHLGVGDRAVSDLTVVDGSVIATTPDRLFVWSLPVPTVIRGVQHRGATLTVSDGHVLLTRQGSTVALDASSLRPLQEVSTPIASGSVRGAAMAGSEFVLGLKDGRVFAVQQHTARLLARLKGKYIELATSGTHIAAVTQEEMWIGDLQGLQRISGVHKFSTPRWSPSGRALAIPASDGVTVVAPDGSVQWTWATSLPVRSVHWLDNRRLLIATGKTLQELSPDGSQGTWLTSTTLVTEIHARQDGWLAIVTLEDEVIFIDPAGRQRPPQSSGIPMGRLLVVWTRDGLALARKGEPGVRWIDPETGRTARELATNDGVITMANSQEGLLMVTEAGLLHRVQPLGDVAPTSNLKICSGRRATPLVPFGSDCP